MENDDVVHASTGRGDATRFVASTPSPIVVSSETKPGAGPNAGTDYGHCAAILESGVYDNHAFYSRYRLVEADRDRWCTAYRKYAETRKGGGGAIEIPDVLKLGGKYDETNIENVYNASCRNWSLNRDEQGEVGRWIATVNPDVVNAWRSCVSMADQKFEASVKSPNDKFATFTVALLRPQQGINAEVVVQGLECHGTLAPPAPLAPATAGAMSYSKPLTDKDTRRTMNCARMVAPNGIAPDARVTLSFNNYAGTPLVYQFPKNGTLRDTVLARLDSLETKAATQAQAHKNHGDQLAKLEAKNANLEQRFTDHDNSKMSYGAQVIIKNPALDQCMDRRGQDDFNGVNVVQAIQCKGAIREQVWSLTR